MKKVLRSIILGVLTLGFTALIAYSGYQLWGIYSDYRAEAKTHRSVMEYKPEDTSGPEEIINQSVIDLQSKYPDAAGWLTLPDTRIDYPFMWYKDNDYYLRRDIDGNYALAGTLFIDYRCEKDFSSPNTIIYGHNMKNGSMFGALNSFSEKTFFDENRYGTVYLPYANLRLEFFAYMVVRPDNAEIYAVNPSETYLGYVKQNARHFRDIEIEAGDRIVTLSTCSYEFNNARMVLIGRVS